MDTDILDPPFFKTPLETKSTDFTSQFKTLSKFTNLSECLANLFYPNLEDNRLTESPITTENANIKNVMRNGYGWEILKKSQLIKFGNETKNYARN